MTLVGIRGTANRKFSSALLLMGLLVGGFTFFASGFARAAIITPGTPLNIGQYCTVEFGSSTDPRCQTPANLAQFAADCAAAGMIVNSSQSCIVNPGGSSGGLGSSGGIVLGTLPSFYYATTQEYVALSRLGQDANLASQLGGPSAFYPVATSIRDSIFSHRARSASGSNAFAWDPYADSEPVDAKNNPFAKFSANDGGSINALGYAKAPVYTKAPPPAPSGVQFAIWGQGFADQEKRTETVLGADVGRTTNTYGGVAGFDAAFTNFLGFGGTEVIGVLGGATTSNVRNNDGSTSRVSGPGVGYYTVFAKGGLSIDTLEKVDFFSLDRWQTGAPVLSLGLTNFTSAANINYRFDLANNWWIEPTAGISYTSTQWDTPSKILGFQNGETTRLQAGSRFGTSTVWGHTTVEASVTGLAYSDVVVNGGSIAVAVGSPLVPTDQGRLFGQGIGKLNFIWTPVISSYVEGEVRGTSGVLGYAGRIGARYSFN